LDNTNSSLIIVLPTQTRGYDISQGPLVVVIFERVVDGYEQVQNSDVPAILHKFEDLYSESAAGANYDTLNHVIMVLGGNHRREAAQSLIRGIDGDTAESNLWRSLAKVPCVVHANMSISLLRYVRFTLLIYFCLVF
jgi:hypothetical protein